MEAPGNWILKNYLELEENVMTEEIKCERIQYNKQSFVRCKAVTFHCL